MNNIDIVREFIRRYDHCVLATVTSDEQPECGIIEFAETPELEIIFDTSTKYRKYKNLEHSPRVALAIGSRETNTGVQYEGEANKLQGEPLAVAKQIFFTKCPGARQWEKQPDTVYYKVTPRWIRYRSYATQPMTEFEFNFN